MRDWIFKENHQPQPPAVDAAVADNICNLQKSVETVIRGKSETVKYALTALLAGGHLLVEDVPGIGKTTLANAIARSLDLTFQRIQFTSDLLPSDVVGLSMYNQRDGDFEWKSGPIFSNIVLADEINRATPKTQSALLEAMAEEQVTVEGVTRQLPRPFVVIATQNPSEHHGTYPLPESQLDRFMMRLHMGYPTAAEERRILRDREFSNPLMNVVAIMSQQELLLLQDRVSDVRFDDALIEYLLAIVQATRRSELIELGVSPRGTLALFRSAQALALIEGRDYCIADDIKRLVLPCFSHRLLINTRNQTSLNKNREAAIILQDILQMVSVPI